MKQPNKEHSNSPRVKEGCKSEMPVHKVKSHKEAEPSLDAHTPDEYEKEILNRIKINNEGKTLFVYDRIDYEEILEAYRKGKENERKRILQLMENSYMSYEELKQELEQK